MWACAAVCLRTLSRPGSWEPQRSFKSVSVWHRWTRWRQWAALAAVSGGALAYHAHHMLYVLFDYGWNVTLCIGVGLAQVRCCAMQALQKPGMSSQNLIQD